MSDRVNEALLYVHVPFCISKCPYCGFFSVTDQSLVPRYVEAVVREVGLRRGGFGAFETLSVGGGTPTVLPDAALGRIAAQAPLAREATLEANPGDVDQSRLRRLREAGFTRISLGVQSFRDEDLKALGRRHNATEAREAYQWAREAGFRAVSIDLIRGIPGQRPKDFLWVLEQAIALGPDHISIYDLTVEDGTPFARMDLDLPKEDEAADLFIETSRRLSDCGYEHYEVSNFAKGAANRCMHNLGYWERRPYLGVGPSAQSFLGKRRSWNQRSVEGWLGRVEAGLDPTEGAEVLTPDQERLERIALGMRTQDGIPLSLARDLGAVRRLEGARLVMVASGRIRPTLEGMLLADYLARELA